MEKETKHYVEYINQNPNWLKKTIIIKYTDDNENIFVFYTC